MGKMFFDRKRCALDANDIECIYRALERGADVRIQNTKDGIRIVEDSVKVLKKKTNAQETVRFKTQVIRYEYTEKK